MKLINAENITPEMIEAATEVLDEAHDAIASCGLWYSTLAELAVKKILEAAPEFLREDQ